MKAEGQRALPRRCEERDPIRLQRSVGPGPNLTSGVWRGRVADPTKPANEGSRTAVRPSGAGPVAGTEPEQAGPPALRRRATPAAAGRHPSLRADPFPGSRARKRVGPAASLRAGPRSDVSPDTSEVVLEPRAFVSARQAPRSACALGSIGSLGLVCSSGHDPVGNVVDTGGLLGFGGLGVFPRAGRGGGLAEAEAEGLSPLTFAPRPD